MQTEFVKRILIATIKENGNLETMKQNNASEFHLTLEISRTVFVNGRAL
jgi:hypothetical protein